MKQINTALAAALFAIVLPAQGDEAKPTLTGLDELVADWKATNETYRASVRELQASDEYAAAKTDRAKMRKLMGTLVRPDPKAFGLRALDLADQYAGEDALKVLVFTANNLYDKTVFEGMVERVEKNHLGSPNVAGMLESGMAIAHFLGEDNCKALLQRIVDENENPLPRAWAKYWQSVLITRVRTASDEDKAAAQKLLDDAEKLAAGTPLAERIAAPRFEKENLQIGMTAPDIEGVDTQGVAFKLSDYRGKVVVLDFWGFW